MSDSNRVGHETADAVERLLLRAGRAAAPAGAKERSLAGASTALAGALVTSHAAAGATLAGAGTVAGAAKAGTLTLLPFIAVTGLTGVGAVTGAMLINQTHAVAPATHASRDVQAAASAKSVVESKLSWNSPPPRPSSFVAPTGQAPMRETVPSVPAEPTEPVRPTIPAPVAVRPSPAESPPAPVHIEVAALDDARHALAAGEPARALSILDAYVARFPHGTMAPEATLVRIEALVKAGDRPAAERAAEALGASNPDNPYRSRVRSLLAKPNP